MDSQRYYSYSKTGAEMIKSFCAMHFYDLGINLNFIDWSTNIVSDVDMHVLNLQNNQLNIQLQFAPNDLVKYARNRDMKNLEVKMKREMNKAIGECKI